MIVIGGTTVPALRRATAWFIDFALVIAAASMLAVLALTGCTLSKALTGLRVAPRAPLPPGPGPARKEASRRAALRAAVTTTADVAVYALACVLLVEGEFLLSTLVWAVAVVVFFLNALPVLLPGRRSLADRVAGTAVEAFRFSTAAAMPPTRTS
ncbi:hypothetical protein [Streptomyces nodosus]|uniref:hypothetical protein n=1 Tax=Streptomyces nodosus TaxID=40318 RepID=UPI0037F2ADE7